MKIVFSLLLFLSFQSYAWSPPESFNSTYIDLEDSIFSATIKGHYRDAEGHISNTIVNDILNDKNHLIKKEFSIPKYFKASVEFWFRIYTQYSSEQVVIHDKGNLKIVYNVIDFSELHNNQSIHRFSKSKLQSHLSLEYTRRLKKVLKSMSNKNLSAMNEEEDDILNILRKSGQKISKYKSHRKKLFLSLANNIRTQTGQRNKVYKGVVRSIAYMPYLKKQIKNFRLPEELLAIPFLESSFNPIAESKVAARGIWQFMPYISNLFMPKIKDNLDYRLNPVIASLAAFHLLKENKLILRRWDLAVTAYNSGPKHLKKAIKKLSRRRKKSRIGLDYILANYKHPHIGFASKNFYSEFLALVHVLAYKDLIYPLKGITPSFKFNDVENLKIYVSKCKLKPKRIFNILKKSSPDIKNLNQHFEHIGDNYPRGSLVISDRILTKRKYHLLNDKTLKSSFPKSYSRTIRNIKCKS